MDDAKKTILARRARFITAALASVTVSACDKPRACLEPPMVTTTAPTSPRPSICLSMARPFRDAGETTDDGDAGASDAGASDASDAGRKTTVGPPAPPPRACLTK